MRLKASTLLTALSLLAAPRALAQGLPAFDLERLRLDPAAGGSLVIGSGEVGPAGTSRTSLSVGYEHDPLVLRGDGTFRGRGVGASGGKAGEVVDGRYTVTAGLALTVVDRVEVFLRVPYVAWQHGDNLTGIGVPKPTNNGAATPSAGLRLGLASQADGAPISIAVAAELMPSWGSEQTLATNGGFAWSPRVEAGRRFERFAISAQAFGFFREAGVPLRQGDVAGNEYGGGVAISTLGKVRGELSYRLALNEFKLGYSSEALAGIRYGAGAVEIFALAGPGFGEAPGTPTWRGLVGIALMSSPK